MDPKYVSWLHALTILGYDNKPDKIVIRTQDKTVIETLYTAGDSPEQALETYKLHLQHNPENK